ncbi:MAG: SRPBCC domain-containing protein, partial [Flavobacteriales bacterium]
SFGFNLIAVFLTIDPKQSILSTLEDGRKVSVQFTAENNQTTITQQFESETQNPLELQQQGWQAILDQFKRYCEQN